MKYSILILFFCASVYGQSIKGIYAVYPLKGLDKTMEIDFLGEGKNAKIYSYIFSKNKSIQKLIPTQETSIDTIHRKIFNLDYDTVIKTVVPTRDIYYKDFLKDILQVEFLSDNRGKSVRDELTKFDWVLKNNTKDIIGYNCKKGLTTIEVRGFPIDIIAWYTEEIPINDGPLIYNGLPGLIVQLEIGAFSLIRLEKIELSKSTEKFDPPKSNYPEQTYKEAFSGN